VSLTTVTSKYMNDSEKTWEPIAAYDRIAPNYSLISERRKAYLDAIDDLIVKRFPVDARSIIDVGAGNGRRAIKIAGRTGATRVVLLEPSPEMRKEVPTGIEVWPKVLEEVVEVEERFEVVLCLWNVLGHLKTEADCRIGLRNLRRLCAPGARVFLDVLHRYNLAECGSGVVAVRLIRDLISLSWHRGEVSVHWEIEGEQVRTRGHVFTQKEMCELFAGSGFKVDEHLIVDYETGQRRKSAWAGNLFYVLTAEP